jgi:hypothetical protein
MKTLNNFLALKHQVRISFSVRQEYTASLYNAAKIAIFVKLYTSLNGKCIFKFVALF